MSKGAKLQQEFDSVTPCKSHLQLAWTPVFDETNSPSSQGVVDFADCAMLPDGSQEKLASADAKMNAFNVKIGSFVLLLLVSDAGGLCRCARIVPSPVV